MSHVSVQEHVNVVFSINAQAKDTDNTVYYQTGEVLDWIGPLGQAGQNYSFFKTEQTFTAYKDGESFPLSTKINQYVVSDKGSVNVATTVIIVP